MRSFLQKNRWVIPATACLVSFIIALLSGVKGSKAEIILKADKDGNITWESEPTMATSGIRWETAGYLIYTTKTPDGDPKSSGLPFARILADEEHVKTETKYNSAKDKYITTNIIDADYIKKAITGNKELYAAFMKNVAAGNNTLYLNSFFRVYSLSNGKKTVLKDNIYSRSEIKKAQSWRNPNEWDTGRGYFNVKVEYKVTSNAYVKIADAYGNYLKDPYLAFDKGNVVYVGDKVDVNLPLEVIAGGKVYTLYRSYYYENTDSSEKKDDVRITSDKEGTLKKKIKLGLRYAMVVGRYKEKNTTAENEDSIENELNEPSVTASIRSDIYEVTRGIPGSESVYLKAGADRYIYSYRLDNKTGKNTYQATGKITWNLTYTTGEGEDEETHNDTVVMTYPVTLTREYSYWEIGELTVYAPSNITAENGAVAGGKLFAGFDPGAYPSVNYKQLGGMASHVKKPDKADKVIDLGTRSYEGQSPPPVSVFEEVNALVGECTVTNDTLMLDGVSILSGSGKKTAPAPGQGPGTPGKSETVSNAYIIDPARANEEYGSAATLTYKKIAAVASNSPATISVDIEDINSVTVHTPVFVKGSIKDATRFCQLVSPDASRFQMVLDRFFGVSLTNYGPHRALPGYGLRDYGRYAAANEVSFPFNVKEGEKVIPAGTWQSLNSEKTYYIPITVREGDYTVKFRSIAINAYPNGKEDSEEQYANLEMSDYTATDYIDVHISGRLYDLTLTDINDMHLSAPVGDKDRNGERTGQSLKELVPFTDGDVSLGASQGILKRGYRFEYSVNTLGEYGNEEEGIVIEPSFYVIGRDGKGRIPVDVYRTDKKADEPVYLTKEKAKDLEEGRVVTWSGSYEIPDDILVTPKGFDLNGFFAAEGHITGREPVFIRKGYLLVSFDVYALKDGKKRLTLSAGSCKMWELQGGIKTKTDIYGNTFEFTSGDFVLYDLQKSLNEDVKVVVIY